MVLANFISRSVSLLNPDDYQKAMGIYTTTDPLAAFKQFIKQYASDIRQAQLFKDQVFVIELTQNVNIYKMSSMFGQLAKFPNSDLLDDESNLKV